MYFKSKRVFNNNNNNNNSLNSGLRSTEELIRVQLDARMQ